MPPAAAAVAARSDEAAAPEPAAAPADAEPHDDVDDLEADDDPAAAPAAAAPAAHPLDGWSDERIAAALASDPASLGAMSLGRPNAGALRNGVQLPRDDPRLTLADPARTWGTGETIAALLLAVGEVHRQYPGAPPLHVGHVSAREGGPLRPHKSHQSGRDVDLGFYYVDGSRWYSRATAENLDRARTWALLRALIVGSDVELVLVDHSIQRLLEQHARESGEDSAWIEDLFRGTPGVRPPLFRHVAGHAGHLHVRFYSPEARETARRVTPHLRRAGALPPTRHVVLHRARAGDTLQRLAKRYGTTMAAIRGENRLRGAKLVAGHTYRIPRDGPPPAPDAAPDRPVRVPPRRTPPSAP
ncbi:MAG: penicillin-insensitive murein endopeptidase [Polyangiaceae bacterium]|nr:penicillin-insensitive murein endopeptidase [Polyangiaceae bacterium]